MNETDLKRAAFMLAEHTPEYLGQPTMPPQGWRLEGDEIVVLLADGRKVRAPMPLVVERSPILKKLISAPPAETKKVISLPVHPPAKKNAGKGK